MSKAMGSFRARRAALWFVATLSLLGCSALLSCGPDPAAVEELRCASRADFEAVSPPLERRCGSAKCHGRQAQGYRVMSASGLRLDPDDPLGTPKTTEAEIDAHYRSLCLLEPELMASVVEGSAAPSELLLIKKAKDEAKHKGKQIMKDDDYLDRCLSSWLRGQVDAAACQNARFEL